MIVIYIINFRQSMINYKKIKIKIKSIRSHLSHLSNSNPNSSPKSNNSCCQWEIVGAWDSEDGATHMWWISSVIVLPHSSSLYEKSQRISFVAIGHWSLGLMKMRSETIARSHCRRRQMLHGRLHSHGNHDWLIKKKLDYLLN